MPTGTSTIFGAFQAIDFSPRYGANADGTPFFSVGAAKQYPSRQRPHSGCESREFDRDQLLAEFESTALSTPL
jgi:hypothetical protein